MTKYLFLIPPMQALCYYVARSYLGVTLSHIFYCWSQSWPCLRFYSRKSLFPSILSFVHFVLYFLAFRLKNKVKTVKLVESSKWLSLFLAYDLFQCSASFLKSWLRGVEKPELQAIFHWCCSLSGVPHRVSASVPYPHWKDFCPSMDNTVLCSMAVTNQPCHPIVHLHSVASCLSKEYI